MEYPTFFSREVIFILTSTSAAALKGWIMEISFFIAPLGYSRNSPLKIRLGPAVKALCLKSVCHSLVYYIILSVTQFSCKHGEVCR